MKSPRRLVLLLAALLCCAGKSEDIHLLLEQAKQAPPPKMLEVAKKVLEIDAKNGDAYAIMACMDYFNGDLKGCISNAQKATALHPTDPFWARTALNYEYHSYIYYKDWKSALPVCLECIKIEHTPGVANDAALLSRLNGDNAGALKYKQMVGVFATEQEQYGHLAGRMAAAHPAVREPGSDLPPLTGKEQETCDYMQNLVKLMAENAHNGQRPPPATDPTVHEMERVLAQVKDSSSLQRIIVNLNAQLTGLRATIEAGKLLLAQYDRKSHRFETFATIEPSR